MHVSVTLFTGRQVFQSHQQVVDVVRLLIVLRCYILRTKHLLFQHHNDHSWRCNNIRPIGGRLRIQQTEQSTQTCTDYRTLIIVRVQSFGFPRVRGCTTKPPMLLKIFTAKFRTPFNSSSNDSVVYFLDRGGTGTKVPPTLLLLFFFLLLLLY